MLRSWPRFPPPVIRVDLCPPWLALFAVGAVACGPVLIPEDSSGGGGGTSSASSGTTAPDPGPADGTAETGPTDTSPTMSAGSFVTDPDLSASDDCDLFVQDCPAGYKCMPWASDGGTWNATRCSPVADNPAQVDEPCTVEGNAVSGLDDCELGSMCWDVDPETNEGVCVPMCIGDSANPSCDDPGRFCAISGDALLILCLPRCNPLVQDCPEGQACYPVQEELGCSFYAGDEGFPGAPCEFINACEPGTYCAHAYLVPGCEGASGCCSPFCSLADPEPPCLDGQTCVPFYAEVNEVPGFDDVGVCAVMS